MKRLLAALLVATVSIPAHASYIVDTGYNPSGPNLGHGSGRAYGGKFSVTQSQMIDAVQSYVYLNAGGTFTVNIYTDVANNVGSLLYSKAIPLNASVNYGWFGATNVAWLVGPGDYWMTFESSSDVTGIFKTAAPSPLATYALNYGGGWGNYSSADNSSLFAFAMRVDAQEVPEPAMVGLFGLGAIGLGLSRRRKTA